MHILTNADLDQFLDLTSARTQVDDGHDRQREPRRIW